jgi:hypothetical protein
MYGFPPAQWQEIPKAVQGMHHGRKNTSPLQVSSLAIGKAESGAVSERAEKAVGTLRRRSIVIIVYTLTATYSFRSITLLLPVAIALPVNSISMSLSATACSLGNESL